MTIPIGKSLASRNVSKEIPRNIAQAGIAPAQTKKNCVLNRWYSRHAFE